MKTIPGFGKSGTSRIRSVRSRLPSALRESAELAPEEQPRELLRGLGERLEVVEPGLAALGVARAQGRRDELLEQARLPPCRVAEGAEVPCVDPVAGEPPARRCDLGVALAVAALAALDPRREQPELLERSCELAVDAGALAELGEVELLLAIAEARRVAGACARRP